MISTNIPYKKHTRLIFKSTIALLLLVGCVLQSLHFYKKFQLHSSLTSTEDLLSLLKNTTNDEADISFSQNLESIKQSKLKADDDNDLWWLNKDFKLPLDVSIPKKTPLIDPYDPRFTINSYLNHIYNKLDLGESKLTIPFHWGDWVDMDVLHKHIFNKEKDFDYCKTIFDVSNNGLSKSSVLKDINQYCSLSKKTPLGYEIFASSGPQTRENSVTLGKSYLYTQAPPPSKLIFLTNSKIDVSYEFQVANSVNEVKHGLTKNGIINSDQYNNNIISTYSKLTTSHPPKKPGSLPELSSRDEHPLRGPIELSEASFDVDIDDVLKNQPKYLTPTEQNYYNSIKYSLATPKPPKYFTEVKMVKSDPKKSFGNHYDWRFFNGVTVGTDEHMATLHRLVKNYLNFARQNNIKTWIAHGSLLSWYWSGAAFPWDVDVDVQMPLADLHYMAKNFNQSLIIENVADNNGEFDGLGRYFLDIGSFVTHREKGNGNNNIDARFIDIDTGAYIDITALALSNTRAPDRYIGADKALKAMNNTEPPRFEGELSNLHQNRYLKVYNCRNNHFSQLAELNPLVPTIVENQIGYVPNDFTKPLVNEYQVKSITTPIYGKYSYLMELGMWVPKQTILKYGNDPEVWNKKYNVEIDQADTLLLKEDFKTPNSIYTVNTIANKLSTTDFLNLLHEPTLFKNYYPSSRMTKYHGDELLRLLQSNHDENSQKLAEYVNDGANAIGSGLKPDNFMDQLVHSGDDDFQGKVDKLVKLFQSS